MRPLPHLVPALVLALSTSSPAYPAPERGEARVFYMSQFAILEGSVTERSIEDHYDLTSIVRTKVPEMLRLLAEASPAGPDKRFYKAFVRSAVRLKIVRADGTEVMMDLYGNVVGLGKPHYLGVEARRRLSLILRSALPPDLVGEPRSDGHSSQRTR